MDSQPEQLEKPVEPDQPKARPFSTFDLQKPLADAIKKMGF